MTRQSILLIYFLVFLPSISTGEDRVLSRGEILQICEAQELLTDLGYSVGPIDGLPGPNTQRATIAFLTESGVQNPTLPDRIILKHLRLHHKIEHKPISEEKLDIVNRPINGQVFQQYGKEGIAPLEIITPSKGYDFYVKLSDVNVMMTSKTFYVRGGSRVETKVPLGTFTIKYATGKEWKSENCLFGINTLYNKAEKVFEFKKVGNQLSGYSVELILQIDGNLSTSQIDPEDW